jgi:hypothetical protein
VAVASAVCIVSLGLHSDIDSQAIQDDRVNGTIPGLKRGVSFCIAKKAAGQSTSFKAQKMVDQLTGDESRGLEDLEECPDDIDTLRLNWPELQSRHELANAL